MPKTKSHQTYKNSSGERVPGVTTILGLLDKPAIHYWIADITKQGYDWTKYRDDKGDIGSLAHAMIMAELKGEVIDTLEYSKVQIDQAENCYLSWLEWRKGRGMKHICIETPLVSERHQFGGTPDYLGWIDGLLVLGDYKTGGIWREAYIQTCAYRELLIENGYETPEKIIILGIPRSEDEKFQEILYTSFYAGWEAFLCLSRLNELLKIIK